MLYSKIILKKPEGQNENVDLKKEPEKSDNVITVLKGFLHIKVLDY